MLFTRLAITETEYFGLYMENKEFKRKWIRFGLEQK